MVGVMRWTVWDEDLGDGRSNGMGWFGMGAWVKDRSVGLRRA